MAEEETRADVTKGALRAAHLAKSIPLVHYPANDRFEDWADGSSRWPALLSKEARGAVPPSDPFGMLRCRHVFFYAGPPCYFRDGCAGNAALYFDSSPRDGQAGGTLPFDSGSLEEPTPKLRPWAQQPVEERWRFIDEHRRALSGWRDGLERWLAASYDKPDRYLETTRDRYAAGEPDRLHPPELLEHNGTRGYARYNGDCADRRAWTWEIHVAGEMPLNAVRAVQVPFALLRLAESWAEQVESVHGVRPEVVTLPHDEPADHDSLYADSGRVLKVLIDGWDT
jgi:hypothetical protein